MDEIWNDQESISNGAERKISMEYCDPAVPESLPIINCNKENDWNGGDQEKIIQSTMERCVQVNDVVDDKKVDCIVRGDKVATTTVNCSPTIDVYEVSNPKIMTISKQRQMQLSNSENNRARKRAMKQLSAKRNKKSKKVAQQNNTEESEELESADCKLMCSNIICNNDTTLPLSPKIRKRVSTLEEMKKLCLSRSKLERLMNLPIFEETVFKCFVRICIRSHKSIVVYRIAEIIGVVELRKKYEYIMGITITNIGLRLKHGRQEKSFPIKYVSNQHFTECEFRWWQKSCDAECVRMPKLSHLQRKLKDIKKALRYASTMKDIECMTTKMRSPSKVALQKTCLMNDHIGAMEPSGSPVVNMLNNEFSLQPKVPEINDNLLRVSYLSGSNDMLNMETSRNIEYKFDSKTNMVCDPFTRRRTQPRLAIGKTYTDSEKEVTPTIKSSGSPPENKSAPLEDLKKNHDIECIESL